MRPARPIASQLPGRAAGFTLLEILIAMLILSVGAASVLALFAAAVSTHRRAVDRTHAALVAERVLAEVQARYTSDGDVEGILEEMRAELPEAFRGYVWEAYLHQPAGGDEGSWQPEELVVRVLVRWKQSGQARSEVFHTILLPRNVHGRAVEPERERGSGRTRLRRRGS